MSSSNVTLMRFDDGRTTLSQVGVPDVVLAVGASELAAAYFRHQPPTPGEIERVIDEIEDALTQTKLHPMDRGVLHIGAPGLCALLSLSEAGDARTREQVEACFQRLASWALGYPAASGQAIEDPTDTAQLVILRECLHHLGYMVVERIQ